MQESSESPSDSQAGVIVNPEELRAGSRVVYPKQGVCKVLGIEAKEIAGQRLEFVSMVREEDNASILVPLAKVASIGLRKVVDEDELADVFYLLASEFGDPELDWKVRHRTHGGLLSAGGILGVAQVLKALQGIANMRPLPQRERERYDEARHLLTDEISVALGVSVATAEAYIDLALLPPPGTKRPPLRPELYVEPPPRQHTARRPARQAEEEDELLDEELDVAADELPEDELPEEEEEVEAEEDEEEAPKAKARAKKTSATSTAKKAPAEAKKKAAPKRGTAKTSTTKSRAKKADGADEGKATPRTSKAKTSAARAKPKAEAKAGAESEAKETKKAGAKTAAKPAAKRASAKADADSAGGKATKAPAAATSTKKKA